VTNDDLGRLDEGGVFTDWAVDWGYQDDKVFFRWVLIDHGNELSYCALTEILLVGNEKATQRYRAYEEAGLDWFARQVAVEFLYQAARERNVHYLLLEDNRPKEMKVNVLDGQRGIQYTARVMSRRLGRDTGKDTLVDWGRHLEMIRVELRRRKRRFTDEEKEKLSRLMAQFP
jgi:hypothetical protein